MAPTQNFLKATLARLPNFRGTSGTRWSIELTFPRLVDQLAANSSHLSERPLEPSDLEYVYWEVVNAWDAGNLAKLTGRTLRRAAQILFWRDVPRVLGEDAMFLKVYFRILRERYRRTSMAKALLFVFLRDYPVNSPTFHLFARLVGEFVLGVPTQSVALQKWRDNIRTYSLLTEQGPRKVAQAWFGRATPLQHMADAGFVGELGQRGFIVYTAKAAAALLSERLMNGSATVADVRWVDQFFTDGDRFRFVGAAKWFAESMLLPFQRRDPQPAIKDAITRTLLRAMGDPRPRRWPHVRMEAQEVFIRWLIGDTIEEFFRLIDRSAEPAWAYRRAFWMAYYRHGRISDVWVILGSDARSDAALRGEQLRLPPGSYGVLFGSDSRQSALLLRIGPLTILEWSHSGACRIWTDAKSAPRLYVRRYRREDLMRDGFQERIRHQGSESYQWQMRLERIIHSFTGISMSSREYMIG